MDKTCDVLVLGGGGAGLTAAARIATLSDLKVTVLEKADFLGGGAIQAGDYRVYHSQWQKDRGLDDKLEEDLLKYMDDTNWLLDSKLVSNTFFATGRFFDWLCTFSPDVADHYEPGRYIFDMPDQGPIVPAYKSTGRARGGTYAAKLLIAQCKKLGVELLTKTPVKDVLVENGKIIGAVAEHEGETFTISCRACILATGSWINNQEILEKANPKYAKIDPGPIVKGGHRSSAYTGDGIALAKKVGAFLDYDSFVLRLMGPLAMMPGQTISSMSNHPYALEVNLNGKRWTCEPSQVRMGVFRSGHLLAEQPEGISYVVFDQNTMEAATKAAKEHPGTGYGGFFGHPSFPEDPMGDLMDTIAGKAKMPFGPPSEDGKPREAPKGEKKEEGVTDGAAPMQGMNKLFRAETIPELAEKMGVPVDALAKTIEDYNGYCQRGFDAEFFKPAKNLVPLTGPYFALRCNLGTDGAFGGVKVNPDMQAYKDGGGLVEGFYVVGDFASGRFINDLGFKRQIINDLSWAFASGLIAGESAVSYLTAK